MTLCTRPAPPRPAPPRPIPSRPAPPCPAHAAGPPQGPRTARRARTRTGQRVLGRAGSGLAATPGRRREAWGHQRRNQLLTHRNRPQQGPPIRAPSGAPPRVQGPCRAASGARAALRNGRVAPARGSRAPVSRRRAVPPGPLRARGRRAVAAARRRLTRIGPTRYGGSTRRVGRSRAFNVWAAAARRRSPRQGPLPPRAEALGSHSPVLQAAIPCHICCHILEI